MASEFDPIIADVAAAMREVIANAGNIAAEVSKKADDNALTATDLVLSFTKMVEKAVSGGVEITQRLVADPPPAATGIADYSRAVGRRMIRESRLIAKAADERIRDDSYDIDDWIESLVRWTDVAVIGGMEIAQTVLAGPARFGRELIEVRLQAPPAAAPRDIGPVRAQRVGPADEAEIPQGLLKVDPVRLGPDERDFRLLVNAYQLVSGVYHGTIAVGDDEITFEFPV